MEGYGSIVVYLALYGNVQNGVLINTNQHYKGSDSHDILKTGKLGSKFLDLITADSISKGMFDHLVGGQMVLLTIVVLPAKKTCYT